MGQQALWKLKDEPVGRGPPGAFVIGKLARDGVEAAKTFPTDRHDHYTGASQRAHHWCPSAANGHI
jgi:hypothetical protein